MNANSKYATIRIKIAIYSIENVFPFNEFL